MAKYVNITSGTSTDLISNSKVETGRISKVYISNNNSTAEAVSVYLETLADANVDYYFIKDLSIPAKTAFILDECLSFDISLYKLKIDHDSSTNLTIIIK
jgi:hypothetical protein